MLSGRNVAVDDGWFLPVQVAKDGSDRVGDPLCLVLFDLPFRGDALQVLALDV